MSNSIAAITTLALIILATEIFISSFSSWFHFVRNSRTIFFDIANGWLISEFSVNIPVLGRFATIGALLVGVIIILVAHAFTAKMFSIARLDKIQRYNSADYRFSVIPIIAVIVYIGFNFYVSGFIYAAVCAVCIYFLMIWPVVFVVVIPESCLEHVETVSSTSSSSSYHRTTTDYSKIPSLTELRSLGIEPPSHKEVSKRVEDLINKM